MEPLDLELDEGELELPAEPMHLNMGPSHPAMHGTVRIVLELSGETIVKADVQIGYLHRGFEKMCERGTWAQVFPYVDRLNYVSPMLNNVGYALAVEKLCEHRGARALPVVPHDPRRARAHQRSPDVHRRDGDGARRVHAVPLVHQGARDGLGHPRRGDRRAPHALVRAHRRHGEAADARASRSCAAPRSRRSSSSSRRARRCSSRTASSSTASRTSASSAARTRSRSAGRARACARPASPYDIRKAHPYLKYDEVDFDVPVGTHGDTLDRFLVRLGEIRQSKRIIEQALERMAGRRPRQLRRPARHAPAEEGRLHDHRGDHPALQADHGGRQGPRGRVLLVHRGRQRRARLLPRVATAAARRTACASVRRASRSRGGLSKLINGRMLSDIVPTFGSLNMIGGECDH